MDRIARTPKFEAKRAAFKIKETGIAEIRDLLQKHYRLGLHINSGMPQAWVLDALRELMRGRPPYIEVRVFNSLCGRAVCYILSAAGLDPAADA